MNLREKMVQEIRDKYGFGDEVVLNALEKVPRHEFVDVQKASAYSDAPISIGHGQTMSQPYTVAFMTHLLLSDKRQVTRDKIGELKVLEIGTGSGYQAAVLAELVKKVYTIEIISELAESAKKTLDKLGYNNVYVKKGSGEVGWKKHAPYDAILITAGMNEVPQNLYKQLKNGGVLIAPVGKGADKKMTRYIKTEGKMEKEEFGIFHFVPFVKDGNGPKSKM